MSSKTAHQQRSKKNLPAPSGSAAVSNNGQKQESAGEDLQVLADNLCNAVKNYSRRHPGAVATAIFFLGFYVGWKVKPW